MSTLEPSYLTTADPECSNIVEAKGKDLKTNCMKMTVVLEEEMKKKTLKKYWETKVLSQTQFRQRPSAPPARRPKKKQQPRGNKWHIKTNTDYKVKFKQYLPTNLALKSYSKENSSTRD